MPKYSLSTPHEVSEAAKSARLQAGYESNQSSYNAAWLHGYASALHDVAQQQLELQKASTPKVLQEILALATAELNTEGNIGYTMPDGKHHIYIYVDDSHGLYDEEHFYVIEPNRVVDGAHEPMGDTAAARYNNFAELLVGCAWCFDQFENDVFQDRASLVEKDGELKAEDLILDDEFFVDDVVFSRVEGYLWATDALVNRMKVAVSETLSAAAIPTIENINFYPVFDLRTSEVHIEGNFWYFDSGERFGDFKIELSANEQALLRSRMEDYCKEKYNITCEELVDEIRADSSIDRKVSLDAKIKKIKELFGKSAPKEQSSAGPDRGKGTDHERV